MLGSWLQAKTGMTIEELLDDLSPRSRGAAIRYATSLYYFSNTLPAEVLASPERHLDPWQLRRVRHCLEVLDRRDPRRRIPGGMDFYRLVSWLPTDERREFLDYLVRLSESDTLARYEDYGDGELAELHEHAWSLESGLQHHCFRYVRAYAEAREPIATTTRALPPATCRHCDKPVKADGLCMTHYQRRRRLRQAAEQYA